MRSLLSHGVSRASLAARAVLYPVWRAQSLHSCTPCTASAPDNSKRTRQYTGLGGSHSEGRKVLGHSLLIGRRVRPSSPLPMSTSANAQPYKEEGSIVPVLGPVAAACCGALAFGLHIAVINGPLQAISTSIGVGDNKALQGLIVSSLLAGAAAGSLTGGSLAESFGRRKAFLICSVPLFLGPILSAIAPNLEIMVAGRVLAGLGIGLSSALVPLYISEVSPANIRGALGSANQLCICLGILAALVVNVLISPDAWRSIFALTAVPAVLLGAGMLMSPESPRWLATKGMTSAAKAAATRLWGSAGPAQLQGSDPESGGAAAGRQIGWGEVLTGPYSRAVLIGCMLFVFQQFAGINAIVFFSSTVFRQAGVQSDAVASAIVGAVNVLGTAVAATLIDRMGRKQLLCGSFAGMGISMLAMAAGLGLPQLHSYAGTIAVAGTLGYIASFALGAGPIPGLLVPEMTAAAIRGRAVSAAYVTHWVTNFAVGQLFLGAIESFGLPMVYTFFGGVALTAVVFATTMVPETKGKSLEQIEMEMQAKRA